MEYTFREVITAILGSAGAIGGLVTVINLITARLDKRRERQALNISASADLRRISLEEEKFDEGLWESVAKERLNRVHELEEQRKAAREVFGELAVMFDRLRVAKIPDEVVDLLAEKIARAREAIARGRDALS